MLKAEFPHLVGQKVSRQWLYQLRKRKQGLCSMCGQKEVFRAHLCKSHYLKRVVNVREKARQQQQRVRRNLNARSYLLEAKEKTASAAA